MIAKILWSSPDEQLSYLTGIGVPSDIPAFWGNVVNAKPKELHLGEVIEFDLHRDGRGKTFYSNIRILAGRAEKAALNSPALNPKYSEPRKRR